MSDIIKTYDNKYVRSLIQLIPCGIGSAIDVYLKETIDEYRKERLTTFFNALEIGKIELTEDVINSEDFLHNYFSTLRIVLNTRRREKITFIGNLFNSAVEDNIITKPDNYEYYLNILDDLSYLEILILETLYEFETRKQQLVKRRAKMQANTNFWREFKEIMNQQYNIDNESLDETLIRIERTSCLYIPRVLANDYRPYAAITTEIYDKLRKYIFK